jgi:hypothetical protein
MWEILLFYVLRSAFSFILNYAKALLFSRTRFGITNGPPGRGIQFGWILFLKGTQGVFPLRIFIDYLGIPGLSERRKRRFLKLESRTQQNGVYKEGASLSLLPCYLKLLGFFHENDAFHRWISSKGNKSCSR